MKQKMSIHHRVLFALLATILSLTGAMYAATPVRTARVTEAVNDGRLVTLAGSKPFFATGSGLEVAPDSLQLKNMVLVLKRSNEQETALSKLLDAQQNPNSSSYHRWLSPDEYGTQFGVADSDIAQLTGWLQNNGFQVTTITRGRNMVVFSGTQAQLRAAFHTELRSYSYNGGKYWANVNDPQIPAAFAPIVTGLRSLNNLRHNPAHTTPNNVRRDRNGKWSLSGIASATAATSNSTTGSSTAKPRPQLETTNGYHLVTPYDFAEMYNVKPLWNAQIDGTGQKIAIVSDSDIDPADVDYFRSTFGLPETRLKISYVDVNPGKNSDEGEADLDVQWAGAVAPAANIELVVGANSEVSSGIDDAALYVINNDLAGILNVSYGQCERLMGSGYNQFYNEIWKQAAAQGISVVVSAGDSGSAGCDMHRSTSYYGVAVNGLASTPYNVSIGGTDFYDSAIAPDNYWSGINAPGTFQSLNKRIPETIWNEGCGSPQILAYLQSEYGSADTTPEQVCNDPDWMWNFMTTVGGSGGASSCSTFAADGRTCTGGYAKPSWQNNVPGLENLTTRSLPDVSLFAGSGLWNAAYLFCQGSANSSGACDIYTEIQAAGGTSFGAPAFSGMLAMITQKIGGRIGNPNYTLYKLAAEQYGDANQASSCTSDAAADINSCVYYDVLRGSNAAPCMAGGTDCVTNDPSSSYGVLSGYDAKAGYDLASGLGTVNAANLVSAFSTSYAALQSTGTAIQATGNTMLGYGEELQVAVAVTAANGTPTGDVAFESDSTEAGNAAVGTAATLNNGQTTASVGGLPVGTYNVYARYGGDANYAASKSTGISVSITKGTTTGMVAASLSDLGYDDSLTLTATIHILGSGYPPSGSITFVNSTTGATLGTAALSQDSATTTSASLTALARKILVEGSNNITATYEGNSNYNALTLTPAVVSYAGPYNLALSSNSVEVVDNITSPVTVTLSPLGTASINPAELTYSCPTAASLGIVCTFSTPVKNADRTVSSALTVTATSPLKSNAVLRSSLPVRRLLTGSGWTMTMMGVLLLPFARRRRSWIALGLVAVLAGLMVLASCGDSSSAPVATNVTLTASSNDLQYGDSLTLTANVQSAKKAPTGSVNFFDGGTLIGTGTLNGGAATANIAKLGVGSHSITALYEGSAKELSSVSPAVLVHVSYTTALPVTVTDAQHNTSTAMLTVSFR